MPVVQFCGDATMATTATVTTTTTCGTVVSGNYINIYVTEACCGGGGYNNAINNVVEQARAIRAHKPAVQIRARNLLLAHLTPAQRKTFIDNEWFVVEGGQSGRRYRINAKDNLVANIDALGPDDRVEHRLCGHCDPSVVPLADHLLAQKLMLEADEDEFLKLANRHAA